MTPYGFHAARVVERRVETEGICTFALRLLDTRIRHAYRFAPGQFNMLYAPGIGEVPISIVSDPAEPELLVHTIRDVGRVTRVMARWEIGAVVGVRGPYGRGWPMELACGEDVAVVTGGLGCAPVVAVIHYVLRRRQHYGTLHILHGVKTPNDLLYREHFDTWRREPRTRVYLSVDRPDKSWRDRVGVVTDLFDELDLPPSAFVMMCGPEVMMRYAVRALRAKGVDEQRIYLSMERNMQCGIGLCGHCQLGPLFLCRDGPVFSYPTVKPWLSRSGT